MDTAHPLLKAVRIPRQVPVHHDAAELEVDPLTRRVRGDHELNLRTSKVLLRGDAVLQPHPAVDVADRETPLSHLARKVVERVFMLREDEYFLVAVLDCLLLNRLLEFSHLPLRQ